MGMESEKLEAQETIEAMKRNYDQQQKPRYESLAEKETDTVTEGKRVLNSKILDIGEIGELAVGDAKKREAQERSREGQERFRSVPKRNSKDHDRGR
jgi:hypothetical protein